MDEKDLQSLFRSVTEEPGAYPDGARKIFNILIRVTLDYRDQMLASRGLVVTVHDVRTSLSWLIPALATGNMPKMENPVCMELLERWLNALKSLPDTPDRQNMD